jgi:hypothetical protein
MRTPEKERSTETCWKFLGNRHSDGQSDGCLIGITSEICDNFTHFIHRIPLQYKHIILSILTKPSLHHLGRFSLCNFVRENFTELFRLDVILWNSAVTCDTRCISSELLCIKFSVLEETLQAVPYNYETSNPPPSCYLAAMANSYRDFPQTLKKNHDLEIFFSGLHWFSIVHIKFLPYSGLYVGDFKGFTVQRRNVSPLFRCLETFNSLSEYAVCRIHS